MRCLCYTRRRKQLGPAKCVLGENIFFPSRFIEEIISFQGAEASHLEGKANTNRRHLSALVNVVRLVIGSSLLEMENWLSTDAG